jgi:hypothetical protein
MAFKMLATVRAPPMRRKAPGRRDVGLLLHQLVEFRQRGLRHFVERGDAHQNVGAHLLGEQRQNRGRLLRLEMREHDRGDLRMLAGDDLRHGLGVHPLQRLDALAGLPGRHAIEQHIRLLLADCLGEHAPDVVLRAGGYAWTLPSTTPMNLSSTEVIWSRDTSLSSAIAMPSLCTSGRRAV